MQPGVIIAILAILLPLWVLLRKDFVKGLSFAIFLWVSMTTFLRIELPGALPALTIHRLMLIVVTIVWLAQKKLVSMRAIPLIGCFVFWFLANLVSLAGTQIDFGTSLKRFLDFVLETFLFYAIISTSLNTQEHAVQVLRGAWLGLVMVAFFAVLERHTGFNPVDRFIPGAQVYSGQASDIHSTYQHRILLGTAMAMGVSLSFVLLEIYSAAGKRLRLFWPGLSLLLAALYYAQSRGPWLGAVLACGMLFTMTSSQVRKGLAVIAILAVLVLLTHPGVIETLTHFAEDSLDKDSFKGGTLQYRMELWRVAYHEVCKSAWLFLCGYGPGAGSEMAIDWVLSYRGQTFVIDSWDNQFAYALFQSGFVGLVATLLLFFKPLGRLLSAWRWSSPPTRAVIACLLATAIVQIWMMTNVLVFAKQLDYLFWTVIAGGLVLAQQSEWHQAQLTQEDAVGLHAQTEDTAAASPELGVP